MRYGTLLVAAAALLLLAAAPVAKTPEQVWRETIAGENRIWATNHHALLKIQDEMVLTDGASATLLGTKGQPARYRWTSGANPNGIAVVSLHEGKLTTVMHGKTYNGVILEKGLAVDANIEIDSQAPLNGSITLVLFNQVRPQALNFKGLDYFPYDPAYRVTATFTPDPKMPPRIFRTSRGTDAKFYHVGDAAFALNGKRLKLPFYALSNAPSQIDDLEGYFTDDLTGRETYGGGRYVSIFGFGKFPPKNIVIDFNLAYNPICARSAYFSCPIATDAIATAIKAGEKDPHQVH